MCGFCPSGLTSGLMVQASGLKVQASYQASGLTSYQASGLIQNHVLNHRRTTREAAARASACPDCGHKWLAEDRNDGRSYGTEVPQVQQEAEGVHQRTPTDEQTEDPTRNPQGVHVRRRLPQRLPRQMSGLQGRAKRSAD